MQRQIRNSLLYNSIIWIVCCVNIAISTPRASGMESQMDTPLSSFGLTEEQFENEAKEFVGIPYRKGGISERGMDCSGFARKIYSRLFGIELPHNSIQQYRFSSLQQIDDEELQPGDLIFFANKKKKRINHVGVYLSDGQFIHASSSKGIMVSNLDDRYWKARFVSSKRHLALNAYSDAEEIRFERSLETPVYQKGMIKGYARDEFRSHASAFSPSNVDTFDFDTCDVRELESAHLRFYEMGYSHSLFNSLNLNFSAIHEKFDASTAWPGFDSYSNTISYRFNKFSSDTAVRQGLKLAGDIRPSNWLSITPSITYFDYSTENRQLLDVPKRTLGVNTLLSPIHQSWSLSMSLQYSDQEDLMSFTTSDNMLNSLDMAVRLGVNLTDNLQFSIMGKHDVKSTAYGMSVDSMFMEPSASDVFLTFDLNY